MASPAPPPALGPDTLFKALKAERTHHGYTYVLGRNECPQPFNKESADGGLYACRLKDLFYWVSLYRDIDHVAVVEIPDDAQRVEFDTKIKASALVLTRFSRSWTRRARPQERRGHPLQRRPSAPLGVS